LKKQAPNQTKPHLCCPPFHLKLQRQKRKKDLSERLVDIGSFYIINESVWYYYILVDKNVRFKTQTREFGVFGKKSLQSLPAVRKQGD
jgi:hypothetical protein